MHKSSILCLGFSLIICPIGGSFRNLFTAQQPAQDVSVNRQAPRKVSAGRKMVFERMLVGEMFDKEREVKFAFTDFRTSDGVRLAALHHKFETPLGAQEYFDKKVAEAKQIIKRENKTDKRTKVIGVRAQVIFVSDAPGKTVKAVLWTNGPHFHEIFADSFPHILELEKRLSN